ncbi:unnamed protein product, partial [marine sediment metagenome]
DLPAFGRRAGLEEAETLKAVSVDIGREPVALSPASCWC